MLDTSEIDVILGDHLERRIESRHPYRVVQKLAPVRRGIQGPFRDVNCSEISAGGISFYLDYPPDFDHFVMTLGTGDKSINVLGQIVGHEQVKGTALVLVHCHFNHRLQASR